MPKVKQYIVKLIYTYNTHTCAKRKYYTYKQSYYKCIYLKHTHTYIYIYIYIYIYTPTQKNIHGHTLINTKIHIRTHRKK